MNRALPPMLRRIAAGAVGLSVMLTPALAEARPAGPSCPAPPCAANLPVLPASPVMPAPAQPADSLPAPATPTAGPPAHTATPAGTRLPVQVRPGDSLWSIAAMRLGPRASAADVGRATRAWYRTNRQLIGDDADLIHPGQVLRPPSSAVETP